ncbi:MAG: hypothetical protein GX970_16890 [Phyllobacteriaceae bacterium]|nr:hypothetical protein [Phyllobacteriaceae bacterium]
MSQVSTGTILEPLHAVIARRRLRAILHGVLAVALAAAAALVISLLGQRLGFPGTNAPLLIIGAALLAGVGSFVLAKSQARPVGSEAFWLDRNSGLEEAYGTAVELVDGRHAGSAVVGALFAKVEKLAGDVAPKRLIPLATPLFMLGLAALVVLLGTAIHLRQLPPPVTDTAITADAVAPAIDPEALTAVSEMLSKDAELRDDPLLDAIARTLAEAMAETPAEELSEEHQAIINDLLDQAAASYGETAPSWLGATEGSRLFELGEAVASMDPMDAPGARPELELAVDPYANAQFPGFDPSLFGTPSDLAGGQVGDEGGEGADVASDMTGALDGDASGPGPQLMPAESLRAIGATPLGAALDSGRGVSHAAGLGQEDFMADEEFSRIGFDPTEEMVLSAEPQQGGRIRIEMVPEASSSATTDAVSGGRAQTASTTSQTADREYIPADGRKVAARYFERNAQ